MADEIPPNPELTAEELANYREKAGDYPGGLTYQETIRLLDEHAAMRTELERLHANNAAAHDALDIRTTELDTAKRRIAELEACAEAEAVPVGAMVLTAEQWSAVERDRAHIAAKTEPDPFDDQQISRVRAQNELRRQLTAAKTELTAEELEWREYIASGPTLDMADADRVLRLLDEHAAMRKGIAGLEHRIKGLQQAAICEREQRLRAEKAESRITELEAALALATDALAAEARAKVEGRGSELDQVIEIVRQMDETRYVTDDMCDAFEAIAGILRPLLARREVAKAKGDSNG